MTDLQSRVVATATAARRTSRLLARASNADRDRALLAIAQEVRARAAEILADNAYDIEAAHHAGLASAMIDRLQLDQTRLEMVAAAVEEVAALPDIIGEVVARWTRPNGLEISRVRIPLGVVAIIYESRPNVTTDAAALCLKAGNAVILRGGKEAIHSNRALGRAVTAGLRAAGLPAEAVQVIGDTDRRAMELLLERDDDIDVVIPRGGEGLIRFVTAKSRIPVLKHYKGVCHVYIDRAADHEMALAIAENAKCQRPGVCNAAETILVHREIAPTLVPELVACLAARGVEIRGDDATRALGGDLVRPATEEDWHAEYLELIVAIRVVDDLAAAVAHIETYGSDHTEAIVTADASACEQFVQSVQSSTVVTNASTRFADGGELGLGAEIGISTTRLHAYGPMGAEGLTSMKFVVRGTGQVRE